MGFKLMLQRFYSLKKYLPKEINHNTLDLSV